MTVKDPGGTTMTYHIVHCRICDDVFLFPKEIYKKCDLIGYECINCKRQIAKARI